MRFKFNKIDIFFFLSFISFLILSWQLKIFLLLLISVLFFLLLIKKIFYDKNFFLITISILFSIILIEILYPYIPSYNNKVSSAYFDEESTYATQSYRDYIKGLGFVPREGTYSSKKVSSKNEIIYDVIYNIGKDNFRKSLFEGKPSIHLFGGSMAFGEGLNDNQTLSYYLTKNHNLKTKNFGVHGYGIHQALFLIEQLNKSAVNGVNLILTGSFHVRRSACKVPYSNGSPYYENNNGLASLNGNCDIRDNFFEKIFHKSNISKLYYQIFPRYGKNSDEDILQYLAIMRSIKRETKKNNSVLVIAYMAKRVNFKDTSYTNDKLFQELSKISDKIIDVTLAKDLSTIEEKYYIHNLDKHASALGNQKRAAELAPLIRNILSN